MHDVCELPPSGNIVSGLQAWPTSHLIMPHCSESDRLLTTREHGSNWCHCPALAHMMSAHRADAPPHVIVSCASLMQSCRQAVVEATRSQCQTRLPSSLPAGAWDQSTRPAPSSPGHKADTTALDPPLPSPLLQRGGWPVVEERKGYSRAREGVGISTCLCSVEWTTIRLRCSQLMLKPVTVHRSSVLG